MIEILGSENVYFQPPPSVQLKYPCFIYSRSDIVTRNADNKNYTRTTRYMIVFVSKNPDDGTVDQLLEAFSNSSYDRHYTSENLNHDVLSIWWEGGIKKLPEGTAVYWVDIIGKPELLTPSDLTWENLKGKPDDLAHTSDLGGVYRYCGSVMTYDDLPKSANAGDTYNVESSGMNYAWTGEFWDSMGEVFKLNRLTDASIDEITAVSGV